MGPARVTQMGQRPCPLPCPSAQQTTPQRPTLTAVCSSSNPVRLNTRASVKAQLESCFWESSLALLDLVVRRPRPPYIQQSCRPSIRRCSATPACGVEIRHGARYHGHARRVPADTKKDEAEVKTTDVKDALPVVASEPAKTEDVVEDVPDPDEDDLDDLDGEAVSVPRP